MKIYKFTNNIDAQKNFEVKHQSDADFNAFLEANPSFNTPDFDQAESMLTLPIEQAVSSRVENGVTIYTFKGEWSYISEDITLKETHEIKKLSKKEVREKCSELFDEISITNEQASDAAMDAIFLNPSFMAIVGALVTGAPKTAKRYILSVGSSLYPPDKIADIVNKLDAIIASEGG